ncbi:MAG: ABC transporter ATP-binding protein [Elusimicrobia bacterium]|nr:ABC transporter ATP-binding protein [Elusimicrobiota bacterium]
MMPVVELRHVNMEFQLDRKRRFTALRDINLEINEGEITAIVGESGCGKSTIGRICLGVLKPTMGAVFYNGRYIWDSGFSWDKPTRCMVQVVHQDSYASLNPLRTIYQTLSDILRFHKITRGDKDTRSKVKSLLEVVGLTPPEYFLDKYPFQLSGGQRQRVSITRATILNPKLIIADEPVSAVDASLRLSILDLMLRLNKEFGIAFLYITHDLATARYFVRDGRMIVMYFGSVVEEGRIRELIDNPRHPYLHALLSAMSTSDPSKAKRKRELPLKSLDMPTVDNLPSGCLFNPRCPYADEICEKEFPQLSTIEGEHRISCYLDRVPRWEKHSRN